MLAVILIDSLQEIAESGQAMARCLGKIGATDEGCLIIVRQKQGQRPTARSSVQHMKGGLINLVEIGPFFAIYFDVDEQRVHELGSGLVLEGFVRHDMAPVTGRITDG